ncbi:DUF4180 domain-containing protein [Paenibacillus motobuensis]|uniref:DUF4180 domain-containing protein n=1 Tax=Paenibacillus TaxID=44249 RepID=UPI00203FE5C3|nr:MULTISPECIES: DUF4180 domain-containing protein [Paenibacillus]MCM3038730.1 DUF4180 domain-containing protein [Paenibacillus lutimineralis]MCM3645834.1 DUF4180 domain-containing protein [Paenibacillus motobuensis]
MNIRKITEKGIEIAIVDSNDILIYDTQSALDLIATISYQTGADRFILNKSAIDEKFFDLKTGLAGEVLQKFINYQAKVAVVGDFTIYSSKSLKDFIYESNHGKNIFFLPDEQQAIDKLSQI